MKRPDLDTLPAQTPATIRHLLARCLVKEPRNRLRDIGEARLAIEATVHGSDDEAVERDPVQRLKGVSATGLLIGAISGFLLGALLLWMLQPVHESAVIKLEVPTQDLLPEVVRQPRISPDGMAVLLPVRRRFPPMSVAPEGWSGRPRGLLPRRRSHSGG